MSVVRYELPVRWILYDGAAIVNELVDAKSAILSLITTPYQRDWVEELQNLQLKMEVAGTSRIEGAEFAEHELEQAMRPGQSAELLLTRSQRQAHAAAETYRWIRDLELDRPLNADLVRDVHRRIVTGCDDDHCEPGRLRGNDVNVVFGTPSHRGCDGGTAWEQAFERLMIAVGREYRSHDPLIQALALHYHVAAMHPFLDGNGRTARALEALLLQRAGLRDIAFVAMSNYYYEEKSRYLAALAEVRAGGHDLTPFLRFALAGVALQCKRVLGAIRRNMEIVLFTSTMNDLYGRLESERKRVIGRRQVSILKVLLNVEQMSVVDLMERTIPAYNSVAKPAAAFRRDLIGLAALEAVDFVPTTAGTHVRVRLDWPARITESSFFEAIKNMPKAKTV